MIRRRKMKRSRRAAGCKYVASYSRKSDAEAHVTDLRRDGYKVRLKVVKSGWTRQGHHEVFHPGRVEVLSCGRKKRRR